MLKKQSDDKEREFTIVGGGAIGYEYSLNQLLKRHHNNYHKLAFIGVDFNEKTYSEPILEMLSKASYISTRSESQSNKLRNLTGLSTIQHYPDLAFSLNTQEYRNKRKKIPAINEKANVFLNLVPLYSSFKNNRLIPFKQYELERSDVYPNLKIIQKNYELFFRRIATDYIKNGHIVNSWSFTPADYLYAKFVLKGINVTHLPYQPNPRKLTEVIQKNDIAVTTRLHATIFSFRSGAGVIPMAYSRKNEELLSQFGFQPTEYLKLEDLMIDPNNQNKVLLANEVDLFEMEKLSRIGIEKGINALINSNS
jgi:polysaccharide pyruvyl transferase WcaK-like protein